jgi:uncharacterized membrane protein
MTLKVVQFVNILLLVLVVGVFWGSWLGLSRSMAAFRAQTFLDIGHAMIANLAPVMPVLMTTAILSTLPVLYLLYTQGANTFYPMLVGFLLFVSALLITLVVEVPIDNQIKAWTVDSLPGNWQQIRDRWELFHVIRTFASVSGLAFIIGCAIFGTTQ